MGAAVFRQVSTARRRRRVLGLLVLAIVATTPGCGGHSGSGGSRCAPSGVVEERPVEVAYRGPVDDSSALLADPAPHLIVQVLNTQPSVERTRLAFGGSEALDVDLPPNTCYRHPPIFSYAYDLPPGPVEVQLDLQGATSTSTIDVPASGTVWAVVEVQSKREWGDITVYRTRPSWG